MIILNNFVISVYIYIYIYITLLYLKKEKVLVITFLFLVETVSLQHHTHLTEVPTLVNRVHFATINTEPKPNNRTYPHALSPPLRQSDKYP